MPLGIVCGLERERRCLERGWAGVAPLPPIAVGMGPDAAAAAARALVRQGADTLVSFGLAGGLAAGLDSGAVVVPETVGDGTAVLPLADRSLRSILEATGGALLGVDQPLADPADKAAAAARGYVAADMETLAVARVAAEAGQVVVAVRVIADPATRRLPRLALVAIGADGRARAGPIVRALVQYPAEWGLVWRLGRDARAAAASLRRVAATLAALAGEGRL